MTPLLTLYLLAVAQTPGKRLQDISLFAHARKVPGVKLEERVDYDWLDNNRVLVGVEAKFGKSYTFAIHDISGRAQAQPMRLNTIAAYLELNNSVDWQMAPNRKQIFLKTSSYSPL